MNKELYEELKKLKYEIKNEALRNNKYEPLVCKDTALKNIADCPPKSIEEFKAIKGLGDAFMEQYADRFFEIVKKYNPESISVNINENIKKTLDTLEKRLINIGKRNRLLYLPKLSSKHSVDLSVFSEKEIINLIFNNRDIVIKNFSYINDFDEELSNEYKKYNTLIRESNIDMRDKGQNNLYIAYPFIIGNMINEDFPIRAPLVLFPVKAIKNTFGITISNDDTRDPVYNLNLLIAFQKFTENKYESIECSIENLDQNNFFQNSLNFYKTFGINIYENIPEFSCFKQYSSKEFPSYKRGEFYIQNCAVIGRFPLYDSSMQVDYNKMINTATINNLLNDMLNDFREDYNYSLGDIQEYDKDMIHKSILENQIFYINNLDSAQENVLSAANIKDELVIHGPPGTGKSQVITSLICQQINNNKSVLMVSEKKTALDVVYSRLGNLAAFSMIIDDVNNKNNFYSQLKTFSKLTNCYYTHYDLKQISSLIEEELKKLEKISIKMFSPNETGIEPYKLYIKSSYLNLRDHDTFQKISYIKKYIPNSFFSMSIRELDNIKKKFSNANLVLDLVKFKQLNTKYPWYKDLKTNLTDFDILSFEDEYKNFDNIINEFNKKSLFYKIFHKNEVTNKYKLLLDKIFNSYNYQTQEVYLKELDKFNFNLSSYFDYQKLKVVYDSLDKTERDYLNILDNIGSNFDVIEANELVYNTILNFHIQKFEADNRDILNDVDDFKNIIIKLNDLVNKKRNQSTLELEAKLQDYANKFQRFKRFPEISRLIENKRKHSVNSFVKKFSYELFNGIKIWFMTPEAVSELLPYEIGLFDTVIFDEASQMYIEKGLPSILRAKQVIIAGDHKQLRPSSIGFGRLTSDDDNDDEIIEDNAPLEEESLLDLARFKYDTVLLNYHYRSEYEELIEFSNHAFYNGNLYVSPNPNRDHKPAIEVHKMEDAKWQNRSNFKEAQYIVSLLKKFLYERENDETIGVITFNSNQRDLIYDLIDEECKKDPEFNIRINDEFNRKRNNNEDIGLFIKNIENVQGDERDNIIFSIGYAKDNTGRLSRNFGWLNKSGGENRLNVAITRAKKHIDIVLSFEPSELFVEDLTNNGPKILKKYLEYSLAVSDNNKDLASNILYSMIDKRDSNQVTFDSDFENQVYDELIARNYTVETQVGIGGYRIDLAIKKDGKYILGIECDGKMYHSSKVAKERDYYRQKYLESRGWKIHRIWSTNWWHNKQLELDKIDKIINDF